MLTLPLCQALIATVISSHGNTKKHPSVSLEFWTHAFLSLYVSASLAFHGNQGQLLTPEEQMLSLLLVY